MSNLEILEEHGKFAAYIPGSQTHGVIMEYDGSLGIVSLAAPTEMPRTPTASASDVPKVPKTRWTAERIAHLGFLIGLGWDAKRIADDPLIVSTPNNVHRQAQRFGLAFRAVPASPFKLAPEAAQSYDQAAMQRGLTREELMRYLLITIGEDATLIDAILDDSIKEAR